MKVCSQCGVVCPRARKVPPLCTKCRKFLTRNSPKSSASRAAYRALNRDRLRDQVKEIQRRKRSDPTYRQIELERRRIYRQTNLQDHRERDRIDKRTKQEWLNGIKDKPCVVCSKSFPACCMDFDHVGPKVKGIGQMVGCSKSKILTEISKCEVICACCHRIRTHPQKSSLNKARQKFYSKVDVLKQNPCIDCGATYPAIAMDFDHVRGRKVATVAQMRSMAWGTVKLELEKCELVCANCHRIRTQARRAKHV